MGDYLLKNIAVIGYGTIGGESGPDLALQGLNVHVVDPDSNARVRASLSGLFAGIYEDISQLPSNIEAVIEAIPELPEKKAKVISDISAKVDESAYILITSSTMPSSAFVDNVRNPERLMNFHILPDKSVRPFIELQGSGKTKPETLKYIATTFSGYGYNIAIVHGESKGFIFNRMWHSLMLALFDLMEKYDYRDVDYSAAKYFNWQYGPVMVMDMIGHDTLYNVFSLVMKERGEIPVRIQQMYDKKTLGLKSKKGFFEYRSPDLEGLHLAGREFLSTPRKPVDEIQQRVWGAIKAAANQLLKEGQEKGEIRKAVRYGFPIENLEPFE